jgi:hypothetical protein
VLRDIQSKGALTGSYHLGDLVGYAPWPNEVVAMIRDAGIPGVAGNYDSTVATAYKHCGCRYEDARQEALSHESYAWTLAHTSADAKEFLGGLPFRIDIRPLGGHLSGPTIRLVHGNHALNTVYVTEDRSHGRGTSSALGIRTNPFTVSSKACITSTPAVLDVRRMATPGQDMFCWM